jgi:hypothetical protein
MNKVRPDTIARVHKREDGVFRSTNVTRFLASCSSVFGLPSEDIFLRNDLIEASSESLARVSRTIIALVDTSKNPPLGHARPQEQTQYEQPSGLSGTAQPASNLPQFSTHPPSKLILPHRACRSPSPLSSSDDEGRPVFDGPVPFPRTVSGSSGRLRPRNSTSGSFFNKFYALWRPKFARGRFQSEISGSSLRRERLSGRSRFLSMVNLSGATITASNLLNWVTLESDAVRRTLIIKEESKPATRFVSIYLFSDPLSQCAGRIPWCPFSV